MNQQKLRRETVAKVLDFIPKLREIPTHGGMKVRIEKDEEVLRVSITNRQGEVINECHAFIGDDD